MFLWMVSCATQPLSAEPWDDERPPAPADEVETPRAATEEAASGPVARASAPVVQDTGLTVDTGLTPTGDTGTDELVVPPLEARLTVDVDEGEYPLTVAFDASDSDLGSGVVRFEWDFDDGAEAAGDVRREHTYVGRGEFDVQLTIVDETTGEASTAEITIDVDAPDCPSEAAPLAWGTLERSLDAVSGIASSRREAGLYWLQEDNDDDLAVVDSTGRTISEHDLPSETDLEDIEIAVDPQTGASMLFVADIGDNYLARDHVEVWVAEEPDPWQDSDIEPLKMELVYPDGPHDAETLLVDPFTLDVFIVTKVNHVDEHVYVKRAPHDAEGPFVLEHLGQFDELDLRATGGAVSPDGFRIIVREYTDTAKMFFRDGYERFEEAFEREPCRIGIFDDSHGEGVTFTTDGRGIVTINEGNEVPLYYIEL